MAITLVNQITGSATNGNNVTVNLTNAATNDLVVACVGGHFNSAGDIIVSSGGWTELSRTDSGATFRFAIYWKMMASTPDTSIVFTGGGGADASAAGVATIVRGVDLVDPFHTHGAATGTSTNPNPPSVSVVGGNNYISFASAAGSIIDSTITVPTGYSNLSSVTANDVLDTTTAMAILIFTAGSASENPPAFTSWSSSSWVATTSTFNEAPPAVVTSKIYTVQWAPTRAATW